MHNYFFTWKLHFILKIYLFWQGEGTCPFGNKCFYKHALPNGELVDVGIPQQRRRYNDFGESNIVEVGFFFK